MKKTLLSLVAFSALVSTLSAGTAFQKSIDTNIHVDKIKPVNVNACKSCHGLKFEKKALGKSNIVSKMSHIEIKKALIGYKNGTRNKHGMGGIMKSQVAKYSDVELSNIADQIASPATSKSTSLMHTLRTKASISMTKIKKAGLTTACKIKEVGGKIKNKTVSVYDKTSTKVHHLMDKNSSKESTLSKIKYFGMKAVDKAKKVGCDIKEKTISTYDTASAKVHSLVKE